MSRLRDPDGGCVWDLGQTFESIAPYTLEEAYEVVDAITRKDLDDLRDELGDLLLQVVYHARMAEEEGAFDFGDVVAGICDKMVRRHPNVFGEARVDTAEAQTRAWEALKAEERAAAGARAGRASALDGVPVALPALLRAAKLSTRAAAKGFEWPDTAGVRDKLDEELAELDEAIAGGDSAGMAAEMGDALFTLVNMSRFLKLDPERCLREANAKFETRFRRLEELVRSQRGDWAGHDSEALEHLWQKVKEAEQTG